ncbi:MAG: TolC family protein [Chlorobi bacterium]|nr:TolC family protein [Chlorobiota bacterium]MCI0714731.1 TolC family protein [Chlorobiota bacterium]
MNKFIAVFVLLFSLNISFSQNVQVLTLSEAINLAKKNNSDYILAKLEKIKADRIVSEVYSENLVPSLTLGSRYTRSFKKQTINIFGENFEIGSDNSITTTLDVSEPIPFLGTPVFTGIRIAEYYSKLQDENISQIEYKISGDVKKSFYNVLLLKEVIELNKQSITNAQENLRVVDARYNAGVALEYDYIRAKVQVETLKPQLAQSENNLQIAKKLLKNIIGLKDQKDIDVSGRLAYDSLEVWGTMENLIKNVSEKNVAVRQLNLTKKINEQLVDVDYANYLPKLYLFGQYQLQANENDERSISNYRFYNSIVAGIGLSWNLNLFQNSYKEDQSIIEVKKSEEQIVKVKELLKTQTESVILKLDDAKNRIKSQREVVITAERGYELANISYKNGVLNQIDVVDAELALSQTKLAYIQAIYDYLIARTELEQLLEK